MQRLQAAPALGGVAVKEGSSPTGLRKPSRATWS